MATITDRASLLVAFGDYVERNDLGGYADKFIQSTETWLNRKLRARDMETRAAVVVTADGGTVPADFLEWISLTWTAAGGDLPARSLAMRFVEANSPEGTYRFRPSGDPQFYTIVAGKVLPRPYRAGTYSLVYYAKIPALTAEATTNWVVEKAPELYLYGMLRESYFFQKDDANAAKWAQAAEARLIELTGEADVQKTGRRPLRAAEDAAEQVAKAASR